MKKIILSVFALAAFGFANAQDATDNGGKGFSNGDVFISGSVGFTSQKQDEAKANSFNVSPAVGFFVSENIAIGGAIGYESTKFEFGEAEDTANTLSVTAFGRYYWTPANDFSFFAQAGVSYMTMTEEEEGSEELKTNGFGIALSPGVSYFISDNFALEASIGALSYSTMKADVEGAEALNTFGLNLDLTDITLGLVYKF